MKLRNVPREDHRAVSGRTALESGLDASTSASLLGPQPVLRPSQSQGSTGVIINLRQTAFSHNQGNKSLASCLTNTAILFCFLLKKSYLHRAKRYSGRIEGYAVKSKSFTPTQTPSAHPDTTCF